MKELNVKHGLQAFEEELAIAGRVNEMSDLNKSLDQYQIVSGDIIVFQFKIDGLQLQAPPLLGSVTKYLALLNSAPKCF